VFVLKVPFITIQSIIPHVRVLYIKWLAAVLPSCSVVARVILIL